MEEIFIPNDTTDLRGYAIRISQGEVFFFNSAGILSSCSIKELDTFHLLDLDRKNNGPWMLNRSYTIYGYSNKNAFKTAAAKMRVGNTMNDYYQRALAECRRQSTKPHRDETDFDSTKFILDVHLPKVNRSKNHMYITVKFVINPNVYNTVYRAIQEINSFYNMAKEQLMNLEEFKGTAFGNLPDPSSVRITPESVVIQFRI